MKKRKTVKKNMKKARSISKRRKTEQYRKHNNSKAMGQQDSQQFREN